MKVAIPSKGRNGRMNTLSLLKDFNDKDVFIFVEPQDYDKYILSYKDKYNIVNILENDKGIGFSRNFIINYFNNEKTLLMLDDDIDKLYKRYELKKLRRISTINESLINEMNKYINKGFVIVTLSMQTYNGFIKEDYRINEKGLQFIYFDLQTLKNYNINYNKNLMLYEDCDLLIQIMSNNLSTINLYTYATNQNLNKNKGGCFNSWKYEISKKSTDIIMNKYGNRFIKQIIDKRGFSNIEVDWKKINKTI